jgi:hypothetical protein
MEGQLEEDDDDDEDDEDDKDDEDDDEEDLYPVERIHCRFAEICSIVDDDEIGISETVRLDEKDGPGVDSS